MSENETSEGWVYLFIYLFYGKDWVEFGNIDFGLNGAQ